VVQTILPCRIQDFPCKYLGYPLSIKKLTKAHLLPLIEKIADCLPRWKAELLNRAGRAIFVQSVLTSTLVYSATAPDIPFWYLKAVDKLRRNFLWGGRKEANGGHCLIAWPKVSRPKELGDLGILDLQRFVWALRALFLWLNKIDPGKPWASLPVTIHGCAQSLFAAAVTMVVGNGANTKFWTDRWLNGCSIEFVAPHLFACLPKKRVNRRTVQETLTENAWLQDIQGQYSVVVLVEFLDIWDLLQEVVLQPAVQDKDKWKFEASGQFSTKLAYEALFYGATFFEPSKLIWKSCPPRKCKFFL